MQIARDSRIAIDGFTNPTFDDATESLLRHCEAHETPQVILERLAVLYQKPLKLMVWVGVPETAGRTTHDPGLYASDLFVKLLKAFRALDWEEVAIILEQAKSPLP